MTCRWHLVKGIGFAFAPVGVELETYCRCAGGEDGAFDGGLITTLKLHIRNQFAEEHNVVLIQRIDGDIHLFLVGKEEWEDIDLDCYPNALVDIVGLRKASVGKG